MAILAALPLEETRQSGTTWKIQGPLGCPCPLLRPNPVREGEKRTLGRGLAVSNGKVVPICGSGNWTVGNPRELSRSGALRSARPGNRPQLTTVRIHNRPLTTFLPTLLSPAPSDRHGWFAGGAPLQPFQVPIFHPPDIPLPQHSCAVWFAVCPLRHREVLVRFSPDACARTSRLRCEDDLRRRLPDRSIFIDDDAKRAEMTGVLTNLVADGFLAPSAWRVELVQLDFSPTGRWMVCRDCPRF